MKNKLSSKDWELISAYLDNELAPREKTRAEEYLNTRPEFKEALEGLRRTKTILQKAPVHKVPRNFTLTAADVQPVKIARWIPTMQWSSAAVALVAVFLFAYQLVPGLTGRQLRASEDLAANVPGEAAMEMAVPMAVSESPPDVIYWGGPPQIADQAFGMGGGGAADCSQPGVMCGGGAADSLAVGGGGEGPLPPAMPFPQPPIPNPLPDLQTDSDAKAAAIPTEPVTGTGPVLGVRPVEEQGETLPETMSALTAVSEEDMAGERQTSPWILGAAGGLLALAIGLFVAAMIARRKSLS
ncbi:MAG: anti-sigma factor family protein [Bellilinea sp.]